MIKKIILTQEEAKAVEWVKQQVQYKDHLSVFIDEHVRLNDANSSWLGEATSLSGMDTDTLIRALYIGYEVEQPKIEIRDYVTNIVGGWTYQIDSIEEGVYTMGGLRYPSNLFKKATDEEIQIRRKEEERQWWSELDRDYREFRNDDIIILDGQLGFKIHHEPQIRAAIGQWEKGEVTGFYPAESFVKFPQ